MKARIKCETSKKLSNVFCNVTLLYGKSWRLSELLEIAKMGLLTLGRDFKYNVSYRITNSCDLNLILVL